MNEILTAAWRQIEKRVFAAPSSNSLFNPYSEDHPDADRSGAHRIRRKNLRNYFDSFDAAPRILIVGEASGPWGCRFSGVPFTSERLLCSGELPFGGRQSSRHETPHVERTAGMFWDVMRTNHLRFLMWNAVPLHPHPPGEPFSLRRPTRSEVTQFLVVLEGLVSILNPAQIVAVGRIAEQAVHDLNREAAYVRHPSHGGMKEFAAGMQAVFSH
jgi:uracil-DNA glycosylase